MKVRWIHINEISECTRHARDIISLGSAGFIMQLTNSLVSICCNNVLSVTGGDIYISVMTIISSVRQMVETLSMRSMREPLLFSATITEPDVLTG